MKEAYVILCALVMGLSMAALALTYLPEADDGAVCDTDTDCMRLCGVPEPRCDGGPQ